MSATGLLVLNLLTFNIWGLPDIGFRVLAPLRQERVKHLCHILSENFQSPKGWDVILLQEVWTPQDRETLKKCGYPYFADQEDKSRILDSGLLILSRYPLDNISRLTFPQNGDPNRLTQDGEALARKSALLARVRPPQSTPIWIGNTHLVSYYSQNDFYYHLRKQQLTSFSNWVQTVAGSEPLIIGGDFNFGSGMPHWAEMPLLFPGMDQAPGADSFCTLCPPNRLHSQNEGKVDHLFGSKQLVPLAGKVVFKTPFPLDQFQIDLSDHYGWETQFQVGK